jgi:hypothetical protein
MTQTTPFCAACDRTSEQVPLLQIVYRDTVSWICPQHLPILIHQPGKLAGKLPGVENLAAGEHD